MQAFNCEAVTSQELESSINKLTSQPVYTPDSNEVTHEVNLYFNFKQALLDETYFSIYSRKTDQYIYSGLFKPSISIQANTDLLKENGGDILIFQFFRKDSKEVCTWENDGGDIVWIANANVSINFLETRELDENNLPVAFKVHVEK